MSTVRSISSFIPVVGFVYNLKMREKLFSLAILSYCYIVGSTGTGTEAESTLEILTASLSSEALDEILPDLKASFSKIKDQVFYSGNDDENNCSNDLIKEISKFASACKEYAKAKLSNFEEWMNNFEEWMKQLTGLEAIKSEYVKCFSSRFRQKVVCINKNLREYYKLFPLLVNLEKNGSKEGTARTIWDAKLIAAQLKKCGQGNTSCVNEFFKAQEGISASGRFAGIFYHFGHRDDQD